MNDNNKIIKVFGELLALVLVFVGISNIAFRGVVQLTIGFVSIHVIYALISGARKAEKPLSDYFKDKITGIFKEKSKDNEVK